MYQHYNKIPKWFFLSLQATAATLAMQVLNITIISGAMHTVLGISPTSQHGKEYRLLPLLPRPGEPPR